MFIKICVLNNFAIFTGKRLCWSFNFIKKRLQQGCFRKLFLKNSSGAVSELPTIKIVEGYEEAHSGLLLHYLFNSLFRLEFYIIVVPSNLH